MLSAAAMATVAELKLYAGARGSSRDEQLEDALELATEDVEHSGLGGRRGIYRGPVESYTTVVSGHVITNTAESATIAGPPDSAGRTLVVRKTDTDRSITAGTVTVTQASPALVETFDLGAGDELHGVEFFTAAVTVALSGVTGAGSGDVLDVGTSEGYTEIYRPCGALIRPIEYPLQRVATVHESYTRGGLATATALVAGTDFELRHRDTIQRAIARLSGELDFPWQPYVKVRLSAGWKGTAGVPKAVKSVVLELAAWHNAFANGRGWGETDRQDGAGSVTYSGPPKLTEEMLARLAGHWRAESMPTAERAWSEVA